MKIRELEAELKRTQKANNVSIMDELPDGHHQEAEYLRAKQDMVNRIVRMEEKNREVERNVKRMQEDEMALLNDFYTVISKLDYQEKVKLIREALRNLDNDKQKSSSSSSSSSLIGKEEGKEEKKKEEGEGEEEKYDSDEKYDKTSVNNVVSGNLKSVILQDDGSSFSNNNNNNNNNNNINNNNNNREAELSRKILELQDENKNLNIGIEELDRQHTESIEELLSLKDDLEKKHRCLQNAYEQLYVDYNRAEGKVLELQGKLLSSTEEDTTRNNEDNSFKRVDTLENVDKNVQTDDEYENIRDRGMKDDNNDKEDNNNSLREMERRVKEILKNSCLVESTESVPTKDEEEDKKEEEEEREESIFEIVARRYVESNWKKDVLERKVNEIARNLKEAIDVKENLQLECDEMQGQIDTLLLNIRHLESNLPSIPEASEERVASLETETESLRTEIKRLRDENDTLRGSGKGRIKGRGRVSSNFIDPINTKGLENGEIDVEENFKEDVDILQSHDDTAINIRKRMEEETEVKEEDSVEDLKRRLLEFSNETNELRTSLEKYKETIEELKLGKENIAHELRASVCSMEELERELRVTLDVKNELEREKVYLIKENEEYRARDLARFKDDDDDDDDDRKADNNDTRRKKDDSLSLERLRVKLEEVNADRKDLEYDLLNMRRELDVALHDIELSEDKSTRLSLDRDRLSRENATLLEQLTSVQIESQEKIELLSTERTLLVEEQSELRTELAKCKEEILRLVEFEERCAKNSREFDVVSTRMNELAKENETLRGRFNEIQELKRELDEKRTIENELNALRVRAMETEVKFNDLLTREKEMASMELGLLRTKFMETEKELMDLRTRDETTSRMKGDNDDNDDDDDNETRALSKNVIFDLKEKLRLSNEIRERLESSIETFKSETMETISSKESIFENERLELTNSLKDRINENDILKDKNDRLRLEVTELKDRLDSCVEVNKENSMMAKETIESLSRLVKEKDEEIESLKRDYEKGMIRVKDEDVNASTEINERFVAMKNERDELVRLVQIKHNESLSYHGEIQRLNGLLNEQASQARNMSIEYERLTNSLMDKDNELATTLKDLEILRERLDGYVQKGNDEDGGKESGTSDLSEHSTRLQEFGILKDKCNAFEAALLQEQSNNRMLQNQLADTQSKEINAGKELERLRRHLVDIEASYTEEALMAEELRKELEMKLLQAEEKLKNSSTVYTSASIRANQQVETLQQQMSLIVQQRDDIQNKLAMAEDKVLSQTTALTNLQIVLEQFQREKERDIKRVTEKLQLQLQESRKGHEELLNEISCLKVQLAEAQEYLQAASRLSEQLDKKTERIEQLNKEVERLTELVNTADQRIEEAMQSGVGKVDKSLMKNLLLGYLSSSTADKSSVLRVFATVLDFTEHDRDKAGLNNGIANNSWFSRLSGGNGAPTKDQEASLSAAFIRFLESESKPKPQLPALPISSSSSPRPTHSRQHSTSSNHSTLLLSNVTLPTFPDFVPARNTGSILKEVLKDS